MFSWDPVKGARYYLLTIFEDDKEYYLFTRERKVFLDKKTRFYLLALDQEFQVIARPDVKRHVSSEVMAKRREAELARQKALQLADKKEEPIAPLSPKEKEAREKILILEKEQKSAFSGPVQHEISLFLGLGQETLQASGGTSEFRGKAFIGATDIDALLTLPTAKSEAREAINAYFHSHTFSIQNEEKISDGPSLTSNISDYQIYHAGIRYQYGVPFFGEDLRLMAGVRMFQAPVLKISSEQTGAASLENFIIYGPEIGLFFAWEPAEESPGHRLSLSLFPWSPSAPSVLIKRLNYQVNIPLKEAIFVSGKAGIHQDRIEYPVNCPDVVSSCLSRSKRNSSWVLLQAGLGIRF